MPCIRFKQVVEEKKHRGSFSGGLSSDMDYFQNRRSKVWPVVEITNLKAVDIIASDLDLRGRTSDPYVEFHANPTDLLWHHPHKLHQQTGKTFPPVTKVISNSLNPVWKDQEVPMLRPQISSQKALDECSLIMLVKDCDALNVDDPLGTVSIRFPGHDRDKSVGTGSTGRYTIDFDEPIDFNGSTHKTGRLKGTITVSWEDEMRLRAGAWYESEYSDGCQCFQSCCQAGCQCTVQ